LEFEDTPEWLDEALKVAKRRERPAPPFTLIERETLKVAQVARKAAWKWQTIDKEDLQQSLFLWCYERPKTIERFREQELGEGALVVSLKRAALKYCLKETRNNIGKPLDEQP